MLHRADSLMTIRIFDAPLHGERTAAGEIRLDAGPVTLRDLIRGRLQQEVERYNQALPETFQGLVQPEESEQILNGFRMKTKRPLDWEVQCRRAYSSFEKNGFLVLVDGKQVTELDARSRSSRGFRDRLHQAGPARRRMKWPLTLTRSSGQCEPSFRRRNSLLRPVIGCARLSPLSGPIRLSSRERDVLKFVEAPLNRLKAEPSEVRLAFVFEALNEIVEKQIVSLQARFEDRGCLPAAERRGAQLPRGGAVGGTRLAAEGAVSV